jgi:uncharacterized membrane protein YkoI
MKAFMIGTVLAVGLFCLQAERVNYDDLPEAVKQTIKVQRRDAAVKEIQRLDKDGRILFEVEFNQAGAHPKLYIAMDGSVVEDSKTGLKGRVLGLFTRMPSLKLTEVPEPVRKTIQVEAKGREVADIDRETWNRQTVYEVEFKQTGRNAQIYVAEDGSIVRDERAGTGLKGLFMGTQLADTPQPVQAVIKREAGTREIADIDKENRSGKTIYEVEIKEADHNFELHIAEDGTILRDSRVNLRGQGTAPGQVGRDAGRGADKHLTLTDVPVAVQRAIKAAGDPATLKPIERKIKDGNAVYEVELQKDGRNTRLEIAEDGTVLKDNRQ